MVGSPEDIVQRRKKILTRLGKAINLELGKPLEGHGMTNFARDRCLVEGQKTGHCYDRESSTLPIWEWMRSVRQGEKPVTTFYFPDNLAGPDLLFALRGSNVRGETLRDDLLLCVVQVRAHRARSTTF